MPEDILPEAKQAIGGFFYGICIKMLPFVNVLSLLIVGASCAIPHLVLFIC